MAGVDDLKGSSSGDRADTRGFLPLFVVAQIFAVISVFLVIVWGSEYLGGFDWSDAGQRFNWHPVLMVVAFVFLYGNGMLVYRLMRNEAKPRLKLIHLTLNGLAFLLAIIGLIAVFSFHNEKNIPNMYSLHSWIGLGTVILFGLNLVGGGLFFLLPQTPDHLRAIALPLHVYGGQAALALITVSIVSGTTEKALFKLTGKNVSSVLCDLLCLMMLIGCVSCSSHTLPCPVRHTC